MRLSVETAIAVPRARVFHKLMDVARWPEAITGIDSVEVLTPGPVGVGTRIRETRRMHGRLASEVMTFAEIVAPGRLALTAESHGTRYRITHELTEAGAGTRLAMHFEGIPVTMLARAFTPIAWLMRGSIERQLAADLADLKRACETAS